MTSAPPTDPPTSRPRWRGIAAWILAVLTAVAVTASVVGLWVHQVAFETDAFMATITPVVESESVQAVVSERIAGELTEALDLETRIAALVAEAEERLVTRLGEALDVSPDLLQRVVDARLGLEQIAPALAAGAEARIEDAIHGFVSSPEGIETLLALVEVAHERTVLLLRDELDQLPNLIVEEGSVRFNAVPLMAAALRAAVNQGLDIVGLDREIPPFESTEDAEAAIQRLAGVLGRELPANFGQVTIGTGENLERAQDLARTFDRIVWLVLIVTVALAVGAAVLAPTIRRGILRVGIAATIGALAGWLVVEVIAAGLPEAAATANGRLAIADMTRSLVTSLRSIALFLAALGAVAAILAFLPTVIPNRLEPVPEGAPPQAAAVPAPTFATEPVPSPAPRDAGDASPQAADDADAAAAAAVAEPATKTPPRRRAPRKKAPPKPVPADEAPASPEASAAAEDPPAPESKPATRRRRRATEPKNAPDEPADG
jgi:hypothetical protein